MSLYPPVSRGGHSRGHISVEGVRPRAVQNRLTLSNFVSARYFETIGQRLVRGERSLSSTGKARPTSR